MHGKRPGQGCGNPAPGPVVVGTNQHQMLRYLTARTAARTAAAAVLPAAAALGLTGCATAKATCVVRHHMAIVIFQDGVGNFDNRTITSFRLTLRDGTGYTTSRLIFPHLVVHPAHGGNPPVVVRAYGAGRAVSCRASQVRTRR